MSELTVRVPAAVAGDPNDVSTALEVAGALWEKGNHEDAIRWVKRAVEAASGDSARAEALTASVVELERAAARPAEATAPVSIDDAEVERATPSPAASPSAGPPAHATSASKPPPVPAAASHAGTASKPPARPTSMAARAPSQPAGAKPRVTSPAAQTAAAAPLPPPVRLPVGQRIRVSVKTSVRDPSLLVVRPLPEGRALPPGTREGTLVLSEEQPEDARSHANGSAPS